MRTGIPLTLITDNMVGHFLRTGNVGAVVVGADRIARQRRHRQQNRHLRDRRTGARKITFRSTWPRRSRRWTCRSRPATKSPSRSAPREEVTHLARRAHRPDVHAAHPAFDVTPARYITAIITERGVARAPLQRVLEAAYGNSAGPSDSEQLSRIEALNRSGNDFPV